ncbi:MAG: Ig-like domain-containing protein [Tannerella sp.]|jgi:hypothetical protein|nr:Ig-like domain-containing protein [Tannerella sp.]
MEKNIYLYLLGIASFVLLFSNCNDNDKDGKAVNITIKNATNISGDIFAINVQEGVPLQLEAFVMPRSAESAKISYRIEGASTGAISISESGLVTPLSTTPATGTIPVPLGTDTIIATVEDGSGTFVRYPVRVISSTVIVSSITIQSAGQTPEIEKGKTFNLAQYVTVNPTNATDRTVTYSSENENVATVDQNGLITAAGSPGQTTRVTITANDRGKASASCFLTIAAEAPLYVAHPVSDKWKLSSNLGTKEGAPENLLDDKNSTFWAPAIDTRPIYSPECWLDIDPGEIIKFGRLGYRHRSLNYSHLQLHSFKLLVKKTESDEWTDLGVYTTEPLKVDNYQLFEATPTEARYIRLYLIKGHLRDGKTDWDYSESGNVSIGDIQVYKYNR